MSQVLSTQKSPEGKETRNTILRIEDLRVNFLKSSGFLRRENTLIKAVDAVSLSLYEGETFSLVGESGSGKSTIANCVMKLIDPDSGKIFFDSEDVTRLKGKRRIRNYRKNVQIVYQDPFESLNPRWDVFTTISMPLRLLTQNDGSTDIRDRVTRLVEEVGLDSQFVMNKFPHQLSGGERQRVNVARALACNPRLLVADEPVTMLDASQRLNILSLLTKLKEDRNLTILLITHDLASAKLMSERTAIMFRGRIVELGMTNIVLSRPQHPYTRLILDTLPSKKTQRLKLQASSSSSEEVISGCSFRSRCKYATNTCSEIEPVLEEKVPAHMAACHNSQLMVAEEAHNPLT